ncbi:MAG: polyprenyl synthetase family protein [Gordonia sp. (in: high G+C Gram-positive bacteria)]|uniref:polyprenyl synthetase family protein n=1 Tax=Gordonia sp. (in: high G+C Gram-positive bacteria) TaxID=84139 RepID=UPI003BB7636B
MLSQQDVPGAVDEVLRDFFATSTVALDTVSPTAAEAGRALDDFVLGGGKRIRPLFIHAGWQCAISAADRPPAAPSAQATEALMLRVGAAIELIQACALVHDDILDRSDTRRGRPTVHRRFERLHERLRWTGDGAHHGSSVAILLGDLALAWADDLVHGYRPTGDAPLPPPLPQAAGAAWSQMRTEVLGGQLLDITNEVSADESVDAAYRVMEFKTAAYTVARPLQIGAALASASAALSTDLRRIGTDLGLAFQLRDDLLGAFGDPAQTGKPSGDDLIAGKRTVLIARALADSGPVVADRLRALLGRPLSPDELADARTILTDSGAVAAVEAQITEHVDEAQSLIAGLDVAPTARADLTALAHRIADRQA